MKQSIINIVVAIAAVFAPAKAMLLTCLTLVLVDLVTGILAAKKENLPITSSGIRRTVTKLLIYELVIALAFLTQTYLTGPSVPVSNIVAGLVGATELLSCIENLNRISGNNLLKAIIEKLNQK